MSSISQSRRRIFIAVTVLFTCIVGLFLCELILRWRYSAIQSSNQLDPSIFRPDPSLGWRLNPGASGRHTHHDFSANYTIGADGFRSSLPPANPAASNVFILGDSFTFGLGVDDAETFTSKLNQVHPGFAFTNGGLPGSSTDQQFLLLKERIAQLHPAHVVLVFYLGNDIFDNARSYPLQLNQPKPTFALNSSGELTVKSATENQGGRPSEVLPQLIFGKDYIAPAPFPLFPRTLTALRIVQDPLDRLEFNPELFLERHRNSLSLTRQIIVAMRAIARESGAQFHLLLLAGRSFVEEPASTSAQFQDVFRTSLLQFAEAEDIPCFDASSFLRNHFNSSLKPLYFRNDGHLNSVGHEILADFIGDSLFPAAHR